MKDLRFALTAFVLALVATCPALAQDDEPEFDPDMHIQQRPSGLYLKGSLMYVDQQTTDVSGLGGAYRLSFDPGWGGSFGAGLSFENSPFSIEVEYTYRQAAISTIQALPGGNVGFGSTPYSHALMFNGVLDLDLGFTPFGFYVGGGIGAVYTDADLKIAPGMTLSGDDTTFAWQVFGGIKWNLDEHWVVFAGVRWFDGGEVSIDNVKGDNESYNVEIGLRFYF